MEAPVAVVRDGEGPVEPPANNLRRFAQGRRAAQGRRVVQEGRALQWREDLRARKAEVHTAAAARQAAAARLARARSRPSGSEQAGNKCSRAAAAKGKRGQRLRERLQ